MLISRKHRMVLINSRQPSRITTVIPTAKVITLRGQPIVAVPHRVDETKVLCNMGYAVPSPIETHYSWSGKQPFSHQIETATFAVMNYRGFILNEMGTGKTLAQLWAYDYLRSVEKSVGSLLVVAPLSTLERTWADEIFRNFPHLTYQVLHGSADRRKKLLAIKADVYIINHDGLKVLEKELRARTDIDVIIVDEIASFRNPRTSRWTTLNNVCLNRKYVWGATGAPTPNSPLDAYGQCRLIAPGRVPAYFGRFRDMVMRQVGPFKWLPRPEAMSVVHNAMQPAIRFSLDECLDLPEQIFVERDVPLEGEQRELYVDMLNRLVADTKSGETITAVNEGVKLNKLIQIACGAPYDQTGEPVFIPSEARVNAVKEIIEESAAKVIVFVPFTGALLKLAETLNRDWPTGVVHGGTSKNERDEVFREFQSGNLRVLVANPGTLSHGLTLTAANTIVWFAPIHSNDTYQQACARVRRPGQKLTTVIVHISGTDVERRIYKRLKNKQSVQNVLLSMVEEGVTET